MASARDGSAASRSTGNSARLPAWVDVVLVLGFLGLAAFFVLGPREGTVPAPGAALVTHSEVEPGPIRPIGVLEARTRIGPFRLRCVECHRLFTSPEVPRQPLMQHRDLRLDHGINDACFNCHDRVDRDRLVVRGRASVPFSEVELLCQQCHGPTYRDWQQGTHGLTLGAWDPDLGPQRRLHCSECHDPHRPAVPPMHPLPGPNTLRMGPPGDHHEDPLEEVDPLRKWRGAGSVPGRHAPGGTSHEKGADDAE